MLTSVFDPARPSALRDLALLAARILLGVVLIAHGLQKLTAGFDGVTAMFAGMGIPLPQAAAAFAIGAEVVGGALLILGFLTPLAALWVVADMAGAFWFVHKGNGVFVTEGGWELVAVIAAAALAVGADPGRFALDRVFVRRPARREEPVTV